MARGVPKGYKFGNRKKPPPFTAEHLANMSKNSTGRRGMPLTEEEKNKLRNDKSPLWKGEDVSYSGIHKWVVRHKGVPDTCEKCGKTGLKGCQINWANVDHVYRRVLDDYIRLCVTCHARYDRQNGIFGKRIKQ